MANIFNEDFRDFLTALNQQNIKYILYQFDTPVFDMTEDNFLSHPNWDVFTFGVPPVAIDIMVADFRAL